jgi:RNA 3'-phosphate cyclase
MGRFLIRQLASGSDVDSVEVDGSHGEGGGQILRTAAAFSVALRKPIHVTNIRLGREVPGLRQQHVSALEILRAVSGGRLEGCSIGSPEIAFYPGTGAGAPLFFDLKTAASITLVLQAVVPAVALSGGGLSLELVGGTDVPWSPTFDYFANVVCSAFSMVGIGFRAQALSRGYYPKGGGRVKVSIEKCGIPKELVLVDPPAAPRASIVSRCGSLPDHVARRQMESAVEVLTSMGVSVGETSYIKEQSASPGSSILVWDLTAGRAVGSDSIGARGKSAESVGAEAGERFASIVASRACVDSNLADMLAPVLSLAHRESLIRIPRSTTHLETSLHVARLFTSCSYSIESQGSSSVLRLTPESHG